VHAAEEDAVLDLDRVELARTHADEREQLVRRVLLDLRRAAVQPRTPEADAGREEKPLPRVRPDGEAEPRVVRAALEPIGAAVLRVRPADRELGRRAQVVVGDRAVADRRAEDAIAARPQLVEELIERVDLDDASFARCDLLGRTLADGTRGRRREITGGGCGIPPM
jgi:hypothetical protein